MKNQLINSVLLSDSNDLDIIFSELDKEKPQELVLKFHEQNLTYYLNRLKNDNSTKDIIIEQSWTELIKKAFNDVNKAISNNH
ncbi:hypothetical protein L21SP5_03644 [Salinivirga cyanobacteriivorans]|uniref:Uncharacterized protein n=1 Tax=Salinivirga cyanobacteriivorans TaxID=1307839 RepID=A0A0S2I4Y1_9BACT|nr:hypothetical protein L21SP5_03644 [Salinivirga cyanobacteriivorans]